MKSFKKILFSLLAFVAVLFVVGCTKTDAPAGTQANGNETQANGEVETYDIKVWVSETEGVKELTIAQIEKFNKEHEGEYQINATVEGVSESESATQMITDVETGADIFCFAQDQLVRLVQAGALQQLGQKATEEVKANNDTASISASSVNDTLYCFPLTSDNGYFMYYDSSVVDPSHVDSLEDIIADCQNAGKYFAMELETSAWYNASFFFATGCVSKWQATEDGKDFESVTDTFNSEQGVVALKGMAKLYESGIFTSSSDASALTAASPAAVLISGTWASSAVKAALGDNYDAADLPSFTVDGKSYHLGSYFGCKLLGMKPQTNAKKASAIQSLCLYLTNEACQLERFNEVGWGPSNKAAQANEAVKADVALKALTEQNNYSVVQGQIHGSWWDLAKSYCTDLKAAIDSKTELTDELLQSFLKTYHDNIEALFTISSDVKDAFTVIGMYNETDGFFYTDYNDEKRSNWSTDIKMVQAPTGTWTTENAYIIPANVEFKVRKGLSWDVAYGDGAGGNYKVTEAGYYYIKFVEATETIELVPAYWSIIGQFGGHSWDYDLDMTIEDGKFVATVELTTEDEFKVRFNHAWAVNYGANGVFEGDNIKVDENGTYKVTLELTAEGANLTYEKVEK